MKIIAADPSQSKLFSKKRLNYYWKFRGNRHSWKTGRSLFFGANTGFPYNISQDFSYALVSSLGLSAEKDVDIQMFDTVQDGFNLRLKPIVLIKNENKNILSIRRACPAIRQFAETSR